VAQMKQQALAGTLRPSLHPHYHPLFKALIPRLWSNDPTARPSFIACASEVSIEGKLPFNIGEYHGKDRESKVISVSQPTKRVILEKEKFTAQPLVLLASTKAWIAWDTVRALCCAVWWGCFCVYSSCAPGDRA
jgi:hypothetical protein